MQKIATRVFMYSSIAFGILGIVLIFIEGSYGEETVINQTVHRLLLATVCIILPSLALSIAGKYLSDKQ